MTMSAETTAPNDKDCERLVAALRNIRDNAQSTLRGPLKTWTAFELDLCVRIANAALAPYEEREP